MSIRESRLRSGLSLALLAALSGVSVETIEQIEAGAIQPSNFTAACLAFAIQRVSGRCREKVVA
jgi:transcriptional regulator with XRE-family HTH domain